MVNLRPRSKARAAAPRASLIMAPTPSGNPDLSETALRKLPRAELQKLAMAHKVKANMKSELIIQQLWSLQIPKKTRPAREDPEEGPSRKRLKREAALEEIPGSSTPENRVTPLDTQPTQDTGSDTTEEEQLEFATPVSSRSGTPPPANVKDLKRCVTIMREISAKDVALLNEATEVRETAAKLRKRARDVRDLVRAESGRRERMEAYFRYWHDIEPTWHRQWLYGEKMVPDYKIQLKDLDEPAGPPTIPSRQY